MKKINLLLCALSLIGTVAATGNESKDFDRIKKNSKVGDTYATCNLSTTATVSNSVTCNGGRDGSVNATPSNGTEPYTYMWGDGNSNSSETGLSAGTYSVTVTDNTGCTATAAATVTQPSILNTSVGVTTNVTCNGGSDGSVSTTPSNGTSPYTYSWAGGGTNSTETGLSAGTYSVTVTDNCGTTATASTTITQPTGLSISATASSSVICFGKYDTLSTTVSGGNVPYTYSWTTGSPTGGLSCSNCQNPVATPAC
ncbi:MAG TPA: SprB repeat-containing protein, partial [Bacteroidia bacterium]|nr:SprB repeat-containing protein [Bacteroidia bacterium]